MDSAIDFCEDVPSLPESSIDAIVACFDSVGATSKVSSIHVNGWFGNLTNSMVSEGFIKTDGEKRSDFDEWAFFGDSANDEPMLEAFEWSFGVANVKNALPRLQHPPKWITPSEGGHGFGRGNQCSVLLIANHKGKYFKPKGKSCQ